MGYYTYHNLDIRTADNKDKHPEEATIIHQLREENQNAAYSFNEDGSCNSETKWYDMVKDMCEFSKKHFGALFVIRGEGEEPDDRWYCYFLHGRYQECRAKITYEDYDFSKLMNA